MTPLPEHLGGFLPQGDPATWLPDLWRWTTTELGVRSVIDIGCGAGYAVRYFRNELGCDVTGVDGAPQEDDHIIEWDFTLGPLTPGASDGFDLAWSCEFVEHVPELCVPNFLTTFQAAKIVLMTHSEPGQPGHHHVNCQPSGYWIEQFESVGFGFDGDLTIEARRQAYFNDFYWVDERCSDTWWGFHVNHFARSGLAFRRMDNISVPVANTVLP